jgi:hypothetical protein
MAKKPSLADTAKHKAVDKESFIYNGKPPNSDSGKEVKDKTVKKASVYIPVPLYIRFKAYELEKLKEGESVSLNGLLMRLLELELERKGV